MLIFIKKSGLIGITFLFLLTLFSFGYAAYEIEEKPATIVIDAGHGGYDGGAVSKEGQSEKDINLSIAQKLEKICKDNGFRVIMTRNEDTALSGKKRDDLILRKKASEGADAFVSIHLNKFPEEKYFGAQVFYFSKNEDSKLLAEKIQFAIKNGVNDQNKRVAKSADTLFLLKNTKTAAAIVECGFLSNEEEAKKLQTDEYQNQLAWSIYQGIVDYFNSKVN